MPSYRSSTLNGYAIILSFNVTKQDQMSFNSTIEWKLTLAREGAHNPNGVLEGSLMLAGKSVWKAPLTKFNVAEYEKRGYLGSGSIVVRHNGDGNLGITYATTLKTKDQTASWKIPELSLSGSYQMPKILPLPNRTSYRTNTANGYSMLLRLAVWRQHPELGETVMRWTLELDSTKPIPKDEIIGYLDLSGRRVWEASTGNNLIDPDVYADKGYIATGLARFKHSVSGTLGLSFGTQFRTKGQTGTTHVPLLSMTGSYQVPTLPPLPNRAAYKSNTANGYSMTLHLTPTTHDIKKNESKMAWKLVLDEVGGKGFTDNLVGNIVIGGVNAWAAPPLVLHGRTLIERGYVAQGVVTLKHTTNGTLGITFGAVLRTKTEGQWWSVPRLEIQGMYQVPLIPKIPDKAWKPRVIFEDVRTRLLTVETTVYQGISPITGYQIRMRNDREQPEWITWTASLMSPDRGEFSFIPKSPMATMEFEARARTEAGWGAWSDAITHVGVGMGPYIKDGGVWKPSNAFVLRGDELVPAICWVKLNGRWRHTTR